MKSEGIFKYANKISVNYLIVASVLGFSINGKASYLFSDQISSYFFRGIIAISVISPVIYTEFKLSKFTKS